jgi:uncharacterized protein (DUF885 family)
MQKLITAHDIHHYERRLEHAKAALASDDSLSKRNKELILAYIKFRNAQGLSIPRQVRYIFSLRKLARLLEGKSFKEAKKQELVEVVSSIEAETTEYDTKRTEKECIKCFYQWIRGGDDGERVSGRGALDKEQAHAESQDPA